MRAMPTAPMTVVVPVAASTTLNTKACIVHKQRVSQTTRRMGQATQLHKQAHTTSSLTLSTLQAKVRRKVGVMLISAMRFFMASSPPWNKGVPCVCVMGGTWLVGVWQVRAQFTRARCVDDGTCALWASIHMLANRLPYHSAPSAK